MIVWLYGAFGAGKTSVAAALRERRPEFLQHDPETVGHLVRSTLPVPTGDFQDLPEWRQLVVATAAALDARGTRRLVVPMTLLRQEYLREILDGLVAREVRVVQVLIDVAEEELRRRIDGDGPAGLPGAVEEVRAWRRDHVADYLRARSWLAPAVDLVVDATHLSVADTADRIVHALS